MIEEIDPFMIGEYCNFRRMWVLLVQHKYIELIDVSINGVLLDAKSNGLKKLSSLLLSA